MADTKIGIDFSDLATDVYLSDHGWSKKWNNSSGFNAQVKNVSGADGGKVARLTKTSVDRDAIVYDGIGEVQYGTAFFRFRFSSDNHPSDFPSLHGPAVRVSGSDGSETGVFFFPSQQDNFIRLGYYLDGDYTTGDSASLTFSEGDWLNILYDFTDTSGRVEAKVWTGDRVNGEANAVTVSIDGPAEAGSVGISMFREEAVYELDFLGYAESGVEAPRSMADLESGDVSSLEFAGHFDGENLDPDASSIEPGDTPDEPLVKITPRALGIGNWYHFLFKLNGAQGLRPKFELAASDYVGGVPTSKWKPWYTYDNPTSADAEWHRWDSSVTVYNTSETIEFQLTEPFPQDEVWIGFQIGYPVGRHQNFMNWLNATHPDKLHLLPSGNGTNVAATLSSQTDELGRTIPGQPLYCYGIWDNATPLDGSEKRIAVMVGGTHAGEHVGDYTFEGFLRWLVSEDPKAVSLRRNFKFHIYPCINPMGRWGGHRREQWDAYGEKDMNRDFVDRDLESTQEIVAAIETDLNGESPVVGITWHGSYMNDEIAPIYMYYDNGMTTSVWESFEAIMDEYHNMDFRPNNNDGTFDQYIRDTYLASHAYTVESAERHLVGSAREYARSGMYVGMGLNDAWNQHPEQFGYSGPSDEFTEDPVSNEPIVADVVEASWPEMVVDHFIDLPATVEQGDLLIAVFSSTSRFGADKPSGWQELWERNFGVTGYISAYYRIADGSEGGTQINIATPTSDYTGTAAQVYRITNWRGNVGDIYFETQESVNGVDAQVPAMVAPWGKDNALWLAFASGVDDGVGFIEGPDGYEGFVNTDSGGVENQATSLASAYKALNTYSEHPGTFTSTSAEDLLTAFIVIRAPEPVVELGSDVVFTYPYDKDGNVVLGYSYAYPASDAIYPTLNTVSPNPVEDGEQLQLTFSGVYKLTDPE